MIRIVIQGINPEPWAMGTIYSFGKGPGKAKISPNEKLVNYQNAVREEIERWMDEHPDQRVNLTWAQELRLFYVRSTARGNVADTTNLNKATEDALQGVLIDNDRFNRKVTGEIIEQHHAVQYPGIIIEIEDYEFDIDRHEAMMAELVPRHQEAFEGSDYVPPEDEF